MLKKICPDCKRSRPNGKYCLDCGTELVEVTTPETNFKKKKTSLSPDTLKKNVRTS